MVLGGIALVALLLTFAGQQIAQGATDLANQVVDGLEQIQDWLKDGPLHASDSQINGHIQQAQDAVDLQQRADRQPASTEVGTAVGHIVAGFFIVLFATYFFLADGDRIWAWVVRLFPRAARARADSSGRVAWTSLTAFVRATVLVALIDAIGIMIVARDPQGAVRLAIGVLVFLGAFIPMIGATAVRLRRGAGRAGRPGPGHRADHARRGDRGAAARGARAAAVPARPAGLGAPARGDPGDRAPASWSRASPAPWSPYPGGRHQRGRAAPGRPVPGTGRAAGRAACRAGSRMAGRPPGWAAHSAAPSAAHSAAPGATHRIGGRGATGPGAGVAAKGAVRRACRLPTSIVAT